MCSTFLVVNDAFIQEMEGERIHIVTEAPGRPNTLHWVREVEPETHAAGVHFKDMLISMKLVDHVGRSHGLESAGIVRRVGVKVEELKPGNRVAAIQCDMMLKLLIVHEIIGVKIADSLSSIIVGKYSIPRHRIFNSCN